MPTEHQYRRPIHHEARSSIAAPPESHHHATTTTVQKGGININGSNYQSLRPVRERLRSHLVCLSVAIIFSGLAAAVVGSLCGTGHCSNSTLSTTQSTASPLISNHIETTSSFSSAWSVSSLMTTMPEHSSTTAMNLTPSPTQSAACIGGTGLVGYAGLCNFCCQYNYCPPGPCTCTAYGTAVPTPPTTGVHGFPAPGNDESYEGLCSYACNHDYCPSSVCDHT